MAKRSVTERNIKREKLVAKKHNARLELKAIINNPTLAFKEKRDAVLALNKMDRNTSSVRVNRRCTCCGRPKAVYRKFTLCRICLRQFAMKDGVLPGVLKASW